MPAADRFDSGPRRRISISGISQIASSPAALIIRGKWVKVLWLSVRKRRQEPIFTLTLLGQIMKLCHSWPKLILDLE